jgi:hypothetical protein
MKKKIHKKKKILSFAGTDPTWLTCTQSGKPSGQDGAKIKEQKKTKEKKKKRSRRKGVCNWLD